MAKAPATTQDDPTRPRPIDENGFELDEWGLPLTGPARLAKLGDRTDPTVDPTGWTRTDAEPAPAAPVTTDTQEG